MEINQYSPTALRCGLLGRKLSHSYSPQIHKYLGQYNYELFEIEPDQLTDFFQSKNFDGINVTIPYKEMVIQYCDELSPIAKRLNAVNTITKRSDGTLIGHNTDYFGFLSTVQHSGLDIRAKKALVLGSGGASKAVCAVLEDLGCEIVVISRTGENNYHNISKHKDAYLLVNATPVGMYPHNGNTPLDLAQLPNLKGVIDLIYNPARTELLLQAARCGLKAINGLWMLVSQAWESSRHFTGTALTDNIIPDIVRKMEQEIQNIVLIGMPGSGKSTIGKLLAQESGRTFVDADEAIVAMAGCSIPEIFSKNGEETFRNLETKVLEQLGKQSGLVIATGGGCVTRSENYPLLHQNSRIYWIQRDISCLPTQGRPLSQDGKLMQLYQIREPLYESFADHSITNDADLQEAVCKIMALEAL